MVDGGKPEVGSREEGKHTGRNDLLYVEKMMWMDELIRRLQSKKKTRVNTDMVGVVRVEFSVIFYLVLLELHRPFSCLFVLSALFSSQRKNKSQKTCFCLCLHRKP